MRTNDPDHDESCFYYCPECSSSMEARKEHVKCLSCFLVIPHHVNEENSDERK